DFHVTGVQTCALPILSRRQFLASKILTNALLSLLSLALITVIGLVTGLIYSPVITFDRIITDTEFLPLYFLEVFFFLSYAMMLRSEERRVGTEGSAGV